LGLKGLVVVAAELSSEFHNDIGSWSNWSLFGSVCYHEQQYLLGPFAIVSRMSYTLLCFEREKSAL
jgi:hypothetical protein